MSLLNVDDRLGAADRCRVTRSDADALILETISPMNFGRNDVRRIRFGSVICSPSMTDGAVFAPPIQFQSISNQPDGSIALTLSSALGDSFWLDRSTNLVAWQPLANVALTNHPLIFVDTNAASQSYFYRARR